MYVPRIQIRRRSHTEWGASASIRGEVEAEQDSQQLQVVDAAPSVKPADQEERLERHSIFSYGLPFLTATDEKWVTQRLRCPGRISEPEQVGLALARHYAEGGEAVPYRVPFMVLDTDHVPARYAGDNAAMRRGLIAGKYPSNVTCVRTDVAGRDYWDATPRCRELFRRLHGGEGRW